MCIVKWTRKLASFVSVFGDKVPYESVNVIPAVGNSPNAAVASTARLGLSTALMTNMGDDQTVKRMPSGIRKRKKLIQPL